MFIASSPDAASSATSVMLVNMSGQHRARMRIVVDDQDAPATQVGLEKPRTRRGGPFAEPRGKPERASLAGLALDRDLAAHQLGQLLGDRQAKPGAAIFAGGGRVGLLEGLEQALDLRLRHADAGVAHGKLDIVGCRRLSSKTRTWTATSPNSVNLTALLQKLIRIWPSRSGSPRKCVETAGSTSKISSEPLGRCLLAHQVPDILQHLVEIEVDIFDRQLAGLDLREIEDVIDDAEQVLAGALDLEHVVALTRREVGLQGEMGQTDDGVHRRSYLVAHIGEEHALGLARFERRRSRLLELGVCPLGVQLRCLAGIDVAPRADHFDGAPLAVADEMLLVAHPAYTYRLSCGTGTRQGARDFGTARPALPRPRGDRRDERETRQKSGVCRY